MALFQLFKVRITKPGTHALKVCIANVCSKTDFKEGLLAEVQAKRNEEDMPVEMENPFSPEKPKCILCKYDIEPDFKNVRLLSQFISSYTGRIYGRHITGLCKEKQERVEKEIKRAQKSGLMGFYAKDPNFLSDPDLYDPTKPFRAI